MPAGERHETLRLSHLAFDYRGAPALRDVTASFATRRIAVLGPNGAGKSTLMGVLSTSKRPCHGTFSHCGLAPLGGGLSAYRRQLGVVPQSLVALPGYSCRELLDYVCWLRRVPGVHRRERVEAALTAVGLHDRAGTPLRHLSGGMLRRLAVAQALVNRPALLLMDEPTAGLDPQQRVSFRALLAGLHETTIVFATHLVEDAAALADELAVLHEGRLLWSGRAEQFVHPDEITAAAVERRYLELVEQAP